MEAEIALLAEAAPWLLPGVAFVFGAMVGSFLNVCIYRIPAGGSVVAPRSHCACGATIAWYDNIPILSWFLLRGRCRRCGARFSFRYPMVELLTGVLFLSCWLMLPPPQALAGMLFSSLLVCATFIDLDHMIIPDRFTLGGAGAGLLLAVLLPAVHGQQSGLFVVDSLRAGQSALVGILIGSGLVFWIAAVAEVAFRKEAMGLGDVKLVGAIGAFAGWQGAVFSVFGGALLGTLGVFVAVLVGALRRGRARPEGSEDLFGREIPFGPMLAAAALLYFLFLRRWVDAYFAAIAEIF